MSTCWLIDFLIVHKIILSGFNIVSDIKITSNMCSGQSKNLKITDVIPMKGSPILSHFWKSCLIPVFIALLNSSPLPVIISTHSLDDRHTCLFQCLTELRMLNLGYNIIEVIPSFALSSRLLLRTLILRNNNISQLDGRCIQWVVVKIMKWALYYY